VLDCNDQCPNDPNKTGPGDCGCGVPDTDTDGDSTADCNDGCPADPNKTEPGVCGCGVPDTDSDGDGEADCNDGCPTDPDKIDPGICGCGVADTDSDGDGTPDCNDGCPEDANKTDPGICGCGIADTDSDGDGTADCNDGCPTDPNKTETGQCGCGNPETGDTDGDGEADCMDSDDDNDGIADASDSDPSDPDVCEDSDGDGCDDCAVGTDNFGPLADNLPNNDGLDTDGDGLCDAGAPDIDGDGINNAVDTLPNTPSSDFSDGTTTGTITAPGDQLVTVTNAVDPDKGVTITADPAGGVTPATVRLCGGLSEMSLDPGDETVVTCGSIIVEVLNGTVEITFVADDGTSATTSLEPGDSLVFVPTTFTFTAPSTNPVPIVVLIEGEELSLEPGESKTMMASFAIDQAKIEVLKGKARVKGTLMLNPNGDDVDISEPISVTVWELSQSVTMVEKGKEGEKWEYKRPKGDTGIIKEMKIDWKKGKFEFSMDKADLSGLTDPNDINISIQIGDDFGQQTILMREKKHHWDYKYHSSGDMAKFQIEHAKLDFKKKPDDDKVRVQGELEFDLVNGDGVDISEPVVVIIGPLSQTITMVEKGKKGEKWEYKRPKDGEGNIKHMTIDWKNGRFEIRLDKADLTGVTNPVTISLQIGNDLGEETIQMREKKHHWDYKD